MEDLAGRKIWSNASARRPGWRAGEIFLIRRVAGGRREINRFESQQGGTCVTPAQ